mmetsp:Transcript_100611/g.285057  ORF Transcript_100611/g.285057 Transcript_100611/m.285057 type:complete len:340 (-) Transcript_100611:602-1621(-)
MSPCIWGIAKVIWATWQAAPRVQALLVILPIGSNFGEYQNMPSEMWPPPRTKSSAMARMSQTHILSVIIRCRRSSLSFGVLFVVFASVAEYAVDSLSTSPFTLTEPRPRRIIASERMGMCGMTPRLSFLTVVTSTGTLFHLPWAMRSLASPGTLLPSMSGCQPIIWSSWVVSRCMLIHLSVEKRDVIHASEPTLFESSSATQSPPQSVRAFLDLRQVIISFAVVFAFRQPTLLAMNSVCCLFASRDQTSATGECITALEKRPAEAGEMRCVRTMVPPSLSLCKATRVGSPPNARMLRWTQRSACCWSCSQRFGGVPSSSLPCMQPIMPRRKSKLIIIVG